MMKTKALNLEGETVSKHEPNQDTSINNLTKLHPKDSNRQGSSCTVTV